MSMSTLPHRIGRIDFDVGVASMSAALALRTQVEQLGWRAFPEAIERVLDRIGRLEQHVRIDRLGIDLGDVAPDDLDTGLAAAFERALESSLRAVLEDTSGERAGTRTQALAAALLDEFEHYLRTGTVAAREAASAYDAAAILRRLIAEAPEALTALLQRHGGQPHVIERLVARAGSSGLRALLDLLSPEHAPVILVYLEDFERNHQHAAPAAMSAPALQRSLWALTITYLLHEAGTQFNRRSYLATLIAGVARAEGLSYAALLTRMQAVAVQTRASQPLAGSMLNLLDVLMLDIGTATVEPQFAPAPPGDEYASAEAGDLRPLLVLLRRNAGHPVSMDALLRPMSSKLFARLIALLQPQHASQVIAYVDDLAALHVRRPLAAQSADRFERQLRMLALRYLLHDAGTQFNRLAWLRRLLDDLAASVGITYRDLLLSFASVLAGLRSRMPVSSSLVEGLGLLADELDVAAPAIAAPAMDGSALHSAAQLARLRAGADLRAVTGVVQACTAAQFADLLAALAPHDALAIELDIARLVRAQGAWRGAGDGSFAQRIAAAGLHALLAQSQRPFERRRWLQTLLRTLDGPALPPYRALARALADRGDPDSRGLHLLVQEMANALAPPDDRQADSQAVAALAERYLRTGQPQEAGAHLPVLAAADAKGFAALLRRLPSAASSASEALVGRLLTWMLPGEIMRALLPDGAETAHRHAEALADQPGADMADAWRRILDAVLRGVVPEAIQDTRAPAAGFDRIAAMRHWLDYQALPWWAPDGIDAAALLQHLVVASPAALHDLVFDADADAGRMMARLRHAVGILDDQAAHLLLERLAPSSIHVLKPMRDGEDHATVREARLRAVVGFLAGGAPDSARATIEAHAPLAMAAPPAQMAQDRTRSALLDWVAGREGAAAPDQHGLRLLADLFDRSEPALAAVLAGASVHEANRRRWAALPDELVARVLYLLAPSQARQMLDLKLVLQAAWRQTVPGPLRGRAAAQLTQGLLEAAAQPLVPAPRVLAAALLERLCLGTAVNAAVVRSRARMLARDGGHVNVAAAFHAPAPQPGRAQPEAPTSAEGTTLYIANAGLVLLHAFLPTLFQRLGVVPKDAPDFDAERDLAGRMRAAYLLQRLVDERPDPPEAALALNKILCGIPLATPLIKDGTNDDADAALGTQLLGAIIANWTAVRSSSAQAIRETFLQRDGRLMLTGGQWQLTVTRKTVDVLVDMVPWSLSIVLHPWMPSNLAVTW